MADFTRVNPSGWAFLDSFTPAQANALDIDHANSLNRAGGTITGNVHVGTGAFITVDAAGTIVFSGAAAAAHWLTGTTATIDAGATFNINNAPTFNGGAAFVTGGTLAIGRPAVLFAAGSLTTGAGAPLVMGASDYPQLTFGHSGILQNRKIPLNSLQWIGGGITARTDLGLIGAGNGASAQIWLPTAAWNGAIFELVRVYLTPAVGHASLPATFPIVQLRKRLATAGSVYQAYGADSLVATAAFTSASNALWINGNMKTCDCEMAETIDPAYIYYVNIIEEAAGGAVAGNAYNLVELRFALADLRPQ